MGADAHFLERADGSHVTVTLRARGTAELTIWSGDDRATAVAGPEDVEDVRALVVVLEHWIQQREKYSCDE